MLRLLWRGTALYSGSCPRFQRISSICAAVAWAGSNPAAATSSSTACTAHARISTSSGEPCSMSWPVLDPRDEIGIEPEHPVEPQHVRDEVVGEHRQPIQIVEVGDACALQIGRDDLCALEERHRAPVISRAVSEAAPLGQRLNQQHSRAARAIHDGGKRLAIEPLHVLAKVAQRPDHQRHQFVVLVLIEPPGELGISETYQLRRRPPALLVEPPANTARDRPITGRLTLLSECGKPPRPEVHSIEREPVSRLGFAGGSRRLRRSPGRWSDRRGRPQAARVRGDPFLDHPYLCRACGNPRTHLSKLVGNDHRARYRRDQR